MSPSIREFFIVRPLPPDPMLMISGTQSGSIQLLTPPLSTPRPSILFVSRSSSRSRFPSALFFARTYSSWSSRRIKPVPGPVFADPALGEGIEYLVPRVLYWKLGLRWTCITGAFADASGAATVTDARSKVGFPHEGQNFFELSLHILKWNVRNSRERLEVAYLKHA